MTHSLAIKNTKDNLKNTFKALEEFTTISGLKLNVEKSEILLLGSSTIWYIPKVYRMLIRDSVKTLGIMIGTSKKKIREENYKPILDNMKETTKT